MAGKHRCDYLAGGRKSYRPKAAFCTGLTSAFFQAVNEIAASLEASDDATAHITAEQWQMCLKFFELCEKMHKKELEKVEAASRRAAATENLLGVN